MQEQDSSHETGVSATRDGANNVIRARQRKANAALQLSLSGASWTEIAQALGYPTPRAARVATERALERELRASDSSIEKMRAMDAARLERLLRSVWKKAIDHEDPEHLAALDKARGILSDHARLLGLNKPSEVIIHNPTMVEIEQWVAQMLAAKDGAPVEEGYDVIEGKVIGSDRALPA